MTVAYCLVIMDCAPEMCVDETAERAHRPRLRAGLAALAAQAGLIVRGQDEHALAQRMALFAFAIRVVGAAIAFASQIVLARLMGKFEYGIFVFVWTLAVIFGNLSCFGFQTAVIRFLPGYRDRGETAEINGLTRTARRFVLASATVIAVLGFAGLHLFAGRIESYHLVPLCFGVFLLPLIALGDVLDGTARANSWPVFGLAPTFLMRPILILVFMWAAVVLGFGRSAETALQAALAATFLTTLSQYLAVTARLRGRYRSRASTVTFSHWLLVALPIFVIEGLYFLLTNADVIVVALFLPPDQVAIYFAAAKTMALVHFVYYAVKAGAAPRFAQLVGREDRAALAVFARQTVAWTFWPSLALGAAVFAAGPFLLSLFGPAFTEGHMLMGILFAGIMAKALVGPGEVLLIMAGEQKRCALLYLAVLTVGVLLNVMLIPVYGLAGAASATAAAMMLEALLLLIVVRRRLGITMFVLAPRLAAKPARAEEG